MSFLQRSFIFSLFFLLGCTSNTKVLVAVASSSQYALEEIIQSHTDIEIIAGATGQLLTQIKNGAPFDIFIPASKEYANLLLEEKPDIPYFNYSINTLSYWQGDPTNLKVVIADPDVAPFGRLAKPYVKDQKVIFGTSISQVNNYILQGLVGSAYTSTSAKAHLLKQGFDIGVWTDYPADQLEQTMLQLSDTPQTKTALKLLMSLQARKILKTHGFQPNF